MGNLGLYKVMTTLAKKVGGPLNLLILTVSGGYGVIRLTEAGIKKIWETLKRYRDNPEDFPIYILDNDFVLENGMVLLKNEKIRVIDEIEEGVLVARDSEQYPFFMYREDLRKISTYR